MGKASATLILSQTDVVNYKDSINSSTDWIVWTGFRRFAACLPAYNIVNVPIAMLHNC